MNNHETESSAEVLPPSSVFALERAAIDTQVATAHQYPRSLDKFNKRALQMATLDEDTAESCIYCRPVGKEQNDKGQWVEKIAEGPSIRLAEIVGCSYGNLRVASRIIEQTPTFVRCEGVCHDLESNYAGKSEIVEATVKKNGEPYSERQRSVVAKVALAKAYRDAIFKVVPRALCKPILEEAKKVAAGTNRTLEQRRARVKAWVSSLKIEEPRVFAVLGVSGWADTTADHLVTLTGLKTAIAEGEPIDQVFPKITAEDLVQKVVPNVQTEPKPAESLRTVQEELESVVGSGGFTFDQFLQYARQEQDFKDNATCYNELPNAFARRMKNAPVGLLKGLDKMFGGEK